VYDINTDIARRPQPIIHTHQHVVVSSMTAVRKCTTKHD
jgi:hypothetical protein